MLKLLGWVLLANGGAVMVAMLLAIAVGVI